MNNEEPPPHYEGMTKDQYESLERLIKTRTEAARKRREAAREKQREVDLRWAKLERPVKPKPKS